MKHVYQIFLILFYDSTQSSYFASVFNLTAFLGNVKVKDLLINLLSRDKADEIQLAAAKW